MRCKVGDLALIVRADNDPECLWRIVTVVALRVAMGELAWQVAPAHYWTDEAGQPFEVMWDDRDLSPLRGDGEPLGRDSYHLADRARLTEETGD